MVIMIETKKNSGMKYFIVFFLIIGGFTTLSMFIQRYTMPKVVAANPYSVPLEIKVNEKGTVKAGKTNMVRAEIEGYIEEINIKEGQKIEEGTVIAKYELPYIEKTLAELQKQAEVQRQDLRIARLKYSSFANEKKQNLINNEKREIEELEKKLQVQNELYQAGATTKEAYENAKQDYAKKKGSLKTYIDDQELNQLTYEKDKINLENQLSTLNKKIETLEQLIENDGKITSNLKGIISTIHGTANEKVSPEDKLCEVESLESGYTVEIEMLKNAAKYFRTNDIMTINISGAEKPVKAQILGMKVVKGEFGERMKTTLYFEAESVQSGMEVKVNAIKRTKVNPVVVPLSAIASGNSGKFVWVINKVDKGFGQEITVSKRNVVTGENDGRNVVVESGISKDQTIVLSISNTKALKEGSSILLQDKEGVSDSEH